MSTIKVYAPPSLDAQSVLPYNHANSTFSTSPFSYKLDEEFDFVEVFAAQGNALPQVVLDPAFVNALFWAIR
jgi:hypothetical protein